MSDDTDLDHCLRDLRSRDRDRYLAILAGPRSVAGDLVALYAVNAELAGIAPSVREPWLGHIRLAWWREAIAEIFSGATPKPQAVLRALARTIRRCDLPAAAFEALIAARCRDLDREPFADLEALENYGRASVKPLLDLTLRSLGGGDLPPAGEEALSAIAAAQAMTGLILASPILARENRWVLPADLMAEAGLDIGFAAGGDLRDPRLRDVLHRIVERAASLWRIGRTWPWPRRALPALLPAGLVPARLERLARANYNLAGFAEMPMRSGLDLWRLWHIRIKGAL